MKAKWLIATGVGAVMLLVINYVVYQWVLYGFYEANMGAPAGVMKEAPLMGWIVVGQLAGAALLAKVLKWKGDPNLRDGAVVGATFGGLWSAAVGFTMLGTMNITSLPVTLVDIVVSVVILGTVGAVMGKLMGR